MPRSARACFSSGPPNDMFNQLMEAGKRSQEHDVKQVVRRSSGYSDPNNPHIFIEATRDGEPIGRMTFELYENQVPRTVANFIALISGVNQQKLAYEGTKIHRIVGGFVVTGGDIKN